MVSCTRKKKTLDRIKGLDHMDSVSVCLALSDRISELPDALLLDILSLLPTQDVVATMVLSKRWKFLWMFVPRLTYDRNMYKANEGRRFSHFLYTSLMLHESPFLESLDIKLGPKTGAMDIGVCVRTTIKRSVRHLDIEIDTSSTNTMVPVVLPVSLYTGATRLVTLALRNLVLMDSSSSVSFPSLKTLILESIKYPTHDFVPMFLSSCPRLQNLYVERSPGDNVGLFIVRMDSLKLLTLYNKSYAVGPVGVGVGVGDDGFLIDAPSLELLEMNEHTLGFCGIEHNMPNIQVADVNVTCSHTGHILSSLVSVQQLELCLRTSKDTYPEGNIFSSLVRLHLCTCESEWLNLLLCLLRDSPKLRILRLQHVHGGKVINPRPCWSKPSHVPQCLVSSLETFEWSQYQGREEEIEVARFILGNSGRLNMAAFYPKSTDPEEKLEMLMELSMSPRRSSICQLDFGRGTLTKIDILSDRHLSERLKDADF